MTQKTVTIEYSIIPHENGYFAGREQKGTLLTNDEALCILKSEMFFVVVNAMQSAGEVGISHEVAAYAMKEIITRAVTEAVGRAFEHIKNPGASQAPT